MSRGTTIPNSLILSPYILACGVAIFFTIVAILSKDIWWATGFGVTTIFLVSVILFIYFKVLK